MIHVTMADVISMENLRPILDDKVPDQWRQAGLLVRPYDRVTTWEFFQVWSMERRLRAVRALLEGGDWPPLLSSSIPKKLDWKSVRTAVLAGKAPTPLGKRRPITIDTRVTHAAQLALARVLRNVIKKLLCPVAKGFVPGLALEDVQLEALVSSRGMVRQARRGIDQSERHLTFTGGFTADVRNFFGELEHDFLDKQIDLLKPWVEEEVLDVLKKLVRIEVAGSGPTTKGVAQGLVLSPAFGNIYLAAMDKALQKALDHLGCVAFRYADDYLVLAPDEVMAHQAFEVLNMALPRCGGLQLLMDPLRSGDRIAI